MGTLKKNKASFRTKAEDGYKSRQGNYPKEEAKSSSEESSYKERQGQTERKAPNKFPEAKSPEKAAEKKQTFGEAFKAARSSGAKNFTFNGKSYNTQLKEEAVKKTTPAAKSSSTSETKPAAKPELKASTAFTVKKATGNQLIERAQATRHPDTSTYKRPGTPAKAKPGSGAPLKSYPSTQKCGGKTKKK